MKKILISSLLLAFLLLNTSCNKKGNENFLGIGIKVINNTSYEFNDLKFVMYNKDTVTFSSIKEGETTDYLKFDSLRYSFYNTSQGEVYFSYKYTAIIDGAEFKSFKGLCGTGLSTETTYDGKFSITLLSIDKDNKTFVYTEKKE